MVCPIAGYKIDENVARIVAGFVLVAVLVAAFVPSGAAVWVFAFLAQDFAFRAFSRPRGSGLGRLAALLLKALGVAPRPVDAGAKRFAARLGLLFSVLLAVLAHLGAHPATEIVGSLLAACAALESILGYCVGCQMWTLWYGAADWMGFGRSER
jgi:hypothetical protein